MVDDGWNLIEVDPETVVVNGNGAKGNCHHANGNGSATITRPRSRSSRPSPGWSSWPRSR